MTATEKLVNDIKAETGCTPVGATIDENGIVISFDRTDITAASHVQACLKKAIRPIGAVCPLDVERDYQGGNIVIFAR